MANFALSFLAMEKWRKERETQSLKGASIGIWKRSQSFPVTKFLNENFLSGTLSVRFWTMDNVLDNIFSNKFRGNFIWLSLVITFRGSQSCNHKGLTFQWVDSRFKAYKYAAYVVFSYIWTFTNDSYSCSFPLQRDLPLTFSLRFVPISHIEQTWF